MKAWEKIPFDKVGNLRNEVMIATFIVKLGTKGWQAKQFHQAHLYLSYTRKRDVNILQPPYFSKSLSDQNLATEMAVLAVAVD